MKPIDDAPSPTRHRVVACLSLVLAVGFAWLFNERYWRWRDCIAQAESSCIAPDGSNLTAGGMFSAVPCLPLAALAGWRFYRACASRRSAAEVH